MVPRRGLEPPKAAFVALLAFQPPGADRWRPMRDSNPRSLDESQASSANLDESVMRRPRRVSIPVLRRERAPT